MTIAAIMLLLCSCSGIDAESETISSSTENAAQAVIEMSNKLFTDRDYNSSYDENTAIKIFLEGSSATCASENVEISKSTVTIKGSGVYILSGSLENGQIIVDIDDSEKAQLVLSNASINCSTSAAIYIKSAGKAFITLADSTSNTLSNTNDFIAIDDNNIDSVIFSKKDLTLNGSGSLDVNAAYGHGIVSKKDLKFIDGNYNINAKEHCLQAKNSIRIAGGSFNLISGEDALHCKYEDDSEITKGFIYIIGGQFNIAAGDDAIHATRALVIKSGMINISECYEGLEGEAIYISGGDIAIKSSDDGINATSSSSDSGTNDMFASDGVSSLTITGGKIIVDAEGDGIDSNGDITISGGEIYVDGPTNSGNGALDYNGTATINGGTLVAVGAAGMAQNFSDGAQCAMLVNAQGMAGSEISLKDSNGDTILTYIARKNYNSVLISCAQLKKGETYTIISGEQSIEVKMDSTIYSNVGGMGMPGGNLPGKGGSFGGGPKGGRM